MHGGLRLILMDMLQCATRIETHHTVRIVVIACNDLADTIEGFFSNEWGPHEQNEIDSFLREFLRSLYDARTITSLNYLKYLKPDDIEARVRTLQRRLLQMRRSEVTYTFQKETVYVARIVTRVCNTTLYGAPHAPPVRQIPHYSQARLK